MIIYYLKLYNTLQKNTLTKKLHKWKYKCQINAIPKHLGNE